MPRILLIGRHGQVSTYLQRTLPQDDLLVLGSDELDLSNTSQIKDTLDKHKVELIINPAAYTAVDQAEEESELAYAINRDAPREIAEWCALNQVALIHFSTDYVFDGNAEKPYLENDAAAPTGVYGASKLAGEQAIQGTNANALILRTSWVYSNHGKNFYKTMLWLAGERDEISVVADQMGSPTYAGSIALACAALAEKILAQPELASTHKGVFHFSCGGETSWHGFASALFEANGIRTLKVNAVPSTEYPTPTKRPAYSVLDNTKLANTFGIRLPSWQNALSECVSENTS